MLKVSTGQGHGQVTWGHHEENYMKIVRHMLPIWVILDVESNGNGNFKIWPEGQVKKGQFSKFKILKIKRTYSVSSQESNGVICFCVRRL